MNVLDELTLPAPDHWLRRHGSLKERTAHHGSHVEAIPAR
jgi:hypothetical protein